MKVRTIMAAAVAGILLTAAGNSFAWGAGWTCLRRYADCTGCEYCGSHGHGNRENYWSRGGNWICPSGDHGRASSSDSPGYGCRSGNSYHGRRGCGPHHRQGKQYYIWQYRAYRTAMWQESDVKQAIGQYADMVKRICFVYMKNGSGTEDVFQDMFLGCALFSEPFDSGEHKKVWLTRVTVSGCEDLLRSFSRTHARSLKEAMSMAGTKNQDLPHVLESVMNLSDKYRIIVYLHYYESYSAVEITDILHKNINTIHTHLSRAKAELKKMLGGDEGKTEYI